MTTDGRLTTPGRMRGRVSAAPAEDRGTRRERRLLTATSVLFNVVLAAALLLWLAHR